MVVRQKGDSEGMMSCTEVYMKAEMGCTDWVLAVALVLASMAVCLSDGCEYLTVSVLSTAVEELQPAAICLRQQLLGIFLAYLS